MAAPRRVIELAFSREDVAELSRLARSRTEPASRVEPSVYNLSGLCMCNAPRAFGPRSALRRCRVCMLCDLRLATSGEKRRGSHVVDPPSRFLSRPSAAANRPWRPCSAFPRVEEESAALRRDAAPAGPPASVRRRPASEPAARYEPKGCNSPSCRAGQFMIDQAAKIPIARTYSPTSAKPPCAVSASSFAASLNGNTVCNDPISPSS